MAKDTELRELRGNGVQSLISQESTIRSRRASRRCANAARGIDVQAPSPAIWEGAIRFPYNLADRRKPDASSTETSLASTGGSW